VGPGSVGRVTILDIPVKTLAGRTVLRSWLAVA